MTKKKKKKNQRILSCAKHSRFSILSRSVSMNRVGGIYVVYSIFGNDIYYVAAHVTTP